jgi:tetratricopeptide (TPR) repeat protein
VSSGALSRTAIAELELQLGCSLRELGRYQLREELLTEALAAHERAAELSSPDTALAARTQLELGHTLLDLHRRWEEASFWERARTAFTTSAYLALPEHPELRAAALRGLAMSMYVSRDASQYREAVNLLQEAMETFTKDAYPFEFAATNQELA